MKIRSCFLFLATTFLLAASILNGQTAAVAPAQVWAPITAESVSIAVMLPAGTTYRFGDVANNRWSAPVMVTLSTTFSPVSFAAGVFPFADPDPGVAKELDVQETAAPQAVTVTNLAASPVTAISQIVPAAALAPVPLPAGTTHTVTFSNFVAAPAAGANAMMVAFVNEPASLAYRAWEGTQMNLTIDGVALVCTYGQTYTDQVFTLTCTGPAPIPGP